MLVKGLSKKGVPWGPLNVPPPPPPVIIYKKVNKQVH